MSEVFLWQDGERRWCVPYDQCGSGRPLLCLPAPSTISTREELRPLARRLSSARRVVCVDWPGFGEADRVAVRYRAPLLVRFLADFLAHLGEPVAVLAAGHASGYLLQVAPTLPGRLERVALLAPSWRGPLPTAMGPHPSAWSAIETVVRAPLVGPLLYALNSSRGFIHWMMRRHVFADPGHITEALLDERARMAHRPGSRFGAAAFVTGGLDAFRSRDAFLQAARRCPAPLLVAIGASSPPRSLAEMQALAALPDVRSATLPGSLLFYEEYPDEAAAAIAAFLDSPSMPPP